MHRNILMNVMRQSAPRFRASPALAIAVPPVAKLNKAASQTKFATCHEIVVQVLLRRTAAWSAYTGTQPAKLPEWALHNLHDKNRSTNAMNLTGLPLSVAIDVPAFAAMLPAK